MVALYLTLQENQGNTSNTSEECMDQTAVFTAVDCLMRIVKDQTMSVQMPIVLLPLLSVTVTATFTMW